MELQATCKMRVLLICGDGMPHLQQMEIILSKQNKTTKEILCSTLA
jgi:hypothetical protein